MLEMLTKLFPIFFFLTYIITLSTSPGGGIGRHKGLKIPR